MGKTIRSEIVCFAKIMYEKNMVNALEGNISVKEGNRIYITPSGVCKGYLDEDMLVVVNEMGEIIEGDYVPSSEMSLHLACYRLRPDISSVVHNHSPYATAYAIANKPIKTRAYPEMIIAFDQIPVIDYGTPSTDEVHAELDAYIDKVDVFLISRHGIVSVGRDLPDAFFKIEAAESIAKSLTLVKLIGGEAPLLESQIDVLYDMRKQIFGRDRIM